MNPNEQLASHGQDPIANVLAGYRALARMLSGARPSEFFDTNITMAQVKVLMLLAARTQPSMSELAGDLHLSLSTVSGLVDRLVESGLALRRTDDNDRRQVIVSLSAEGSALLDRFQELGASQLRELLETMTPEAIETVGRAIDLLIEAAQALPREEHP